MKSEQKALPLRSRLSFPSPWGAAGCWQPSPRPLRSHSVPRTWPRGTAASLSSVAHKHKLKLPLWYFRPQGFLPYLVTLRCVSCPHPHKRVREGAVLRSKQ